MATLIGIAVRPPKTRDITLRDSVKISAENGIAGDKRSRPGKRQVTLMSAAAWENVCRDLGKDLPWTLRRANLLVDDLPLEQSTGQTIVIGDVTLEITGETDPCRLMDDAYDGLQQALSADWRGGVTCRVITGGEVKTGLKVALKPGLNNIY